MSKSTRPSKKRILTEIKREKQMHNIESIMGLVDANHPLEIKAASMDIPVSQIWRNIKMEVTHP